MVLSYKLNFVYWFGFRLKPSDTTDSKTMLLPLKVVRIDPKVNNSLFLPRFILNPRFTRGIMMVVISYVSIESSVEAICWLDYIWGHVLGKSPTYHLKRAKKQVNSFPIAFFSSYTENCTIVYVVGKTYNHCHIRILF